MYSIKENGNIVGSNPDILIAEIFPCIYHTRESGHFILIVNFVRLPIGNIVCIFRRIKLTLFVATRFDRRVSIVLSSIVPSL